VHFDYTLYNYENIFCAKKHTKKVKE
jgi:hypothetical protein